MKKSQKYTEKELKDLLLNAGAKEHKIGTLQRYLVNVTPEIASNLLLNNSLNRDIRQKNVDKIAEDMREGRFKRTHDAIGFDNEGVLIDGQHRLKAIVESQTTYEMEIVFGLDTKVRTVIDIGAKRTGSDIITIVDLQEGGESIYSNQKSATVKRILAWGYDKNASKVSITKEQNHAIMDFYTDNELLSYVVKQAHTSKFRLISSSTLAAAWYLIAKTEQKAKGNSNYDETEVFFEKLTSGIGLVENTSISKLRKMFEENHSRSFVKNKQNTDGFSIIETWNKYHKNPDRQYKNFTRVLRLPEEILF